MKKFVAYYRVSSRQQEASHLSLEAQRSTVMEYVRHHGRLIAEFDEVMSGANDDRPQLIAAIRLAKAEDATLVVARLDRLSRNVSFISKQLDQDVRFIALDIPDATEFTFHIYAAIAQQERKYISERTKAALDAKRLREPDWKPGTVANLTDAGRDKAHAVLRQRARSDVRNRHAYHFIRGRVENGESFLSVAKALNAEGYVSSRNRPFSRHTVRLLYMRFKSEEE